MDEQKTPKYQGLQILRILAASMVLVTHATFYSSERLGFAHDRVWYRGSSGVDIFFVLSGFVMILSSGKLFGDPDGWKIFAERRIVRIVPMYWLFTTAKIAIMLLAVGVVKHAVFSMPKAIFSYLFLPTYNVDGDIEPVLSVGWTLDFEMFFYLLFTLALWLRKDVFRFLGIALTLLTVGAYFRRLSWPPVAFYLDTIVMEFYFGMLIAQAMKRRRLLAPPLAFTLLMVGFALLIFDAKFPMSVPRGLVLGVPAAMMLWGITSLERYLSNVPKLILYLADASYVIYLIHPFVAAAPAAMMVKLHHEHYWLAVILAFFISLLVGAAAHQFIEKPTSMWCRNHVRVGKRKVIHVS